MHKAKYYYNQSTCSYERVKISVIGLLLRSCVLILFVIGVAVVIVKYYNGFFVSPREVSLLEDNEKLKSYYYSIQKKAEKNGEILAALQERDDTLYRVLLNTAPLSSAERNAGIGGVDKYAHLGKEVLIAQTLSSVDQLTSKLAIQKKSFDYVLSVAKKTAKKLRSMPTFPPLSKKNLKRISAPFGMRLHPIHKIYKMHKGIDLSAPIGTPIYVAADGYVKFVRNSKKGYGNHILIEHGCGFQTLYGHMNSITVREKQKIIRGQKIGTVGNSGDSTASHLHYSVYSNGNLVNPMNYFVGELTPEEYEEVRKQAATQNQALCSNF